MSVHASYPTAPDSEPFALKDLIAAQSDRLAALQTHKQGLLQQLFPSPAEANA